MLEMIFSYLDKGGMILWIIALMSVFWLSVVLYKAYEFNRFGITRFSDIDGALTHWLMEPNEKALEALKQAKNPTARVLEVAIKGICGGCSHEEKIREEVTRIAQLELERLRKGLGLIEVIALVSPLIGLLGTVLGIIEAFHQISLSTDQVNPAVLSGGIWTALLTTAAGLALGIPATLSQAWMEHKLDSLAHQMNNAVMQIFTRNVICECMRATTVSNQVNVATHST